MEVPCDCRPWTSISSHQDYLQTVVMHYPGSTFPDNQNESHKPLPGLLYLSIMDKWEKHQAFTCSLFTHMHKQREKEKSSPGTF